MQCITIENLTKKFGKLSVFNKATLQVEEKSIIGITGKNGSGKTTLLKILAGLLLPDEGSVFIYEKDITKKPVYAKKIVSLSLNSESGFYPQLSVKENLEFLCLIYKKKIKDIQNYIEILGLEQFLDVKFQFCSTGMKTKLWFLFSVIKDTKILLIDELTKSMDFETKSKIYSLIKMLNEEYKKTIIFVSHNPDEIKFLAHKKLHIENKQILEL